MAIGFDRIGHLIMTLLLACAPLACGGGGGGGGDDTDDDDVTSNDDDDITDDDDDVTDDDDDLPEVPEDLAWSFWDEGSNAACQPLEVQCLESSHCDDGFACKSYQCVGPDTAESYDFSGHTSFLSQLQVPSAVGDEPCCHDVDGDGEIDNNMEVLLVALAGVNSYNPDRLNRFFQDGIDSDANNLVVEFDRAPDDECVPVRLAFLPGEGDLDHDGFTDQTPAQRAAGEGVFQINPAGFDANGPISQANRATIEDGILRVEGGSAVFSFQLEDGQQVRLPVDGLRLEGAVAVVDGQIFSEDAVIRGRRIKNSLEDATPPTPGSIAVSGTVRLAPIMQQINDTAAECGCLALDPSLPLIDYGIEGGLFRVDCQQEVSNSQELCKSQTDGVICASMGEICTNLQFLGIVADVSSGDQGPDGTTALDSVSFGLRASLSGAEFGQQILASLFFATDDHLRVPYNTQNFRLNVLFNDVDVINLKPSLHDIMLPPGHGDATVTPEGSAILYTPEPDYLGTDGLTYRIFDGINYREAAVMLEVFMPPYCGDGNLDPGETCDEGALNGQPLHCDLFCEGVTSAVCGNGILEAGEACDDGGSNGQPNQCDTGCQGTTPSVCGNEVVEDGETCETGQSEACTVGETAGLAACNETCTGYGECVSSTHCGNGVLEVPEVCETGTSAPCVEAGTGYNGQQPCLEDCSGYAACVPTEFCGDGVINGNEACDQPEPVVGDGCVECQSAPGCSLARVADGGFEDAGGSALVFPSDGDADDEMLKVNLPFAFNFFGTDHNSVWVTTNGYLQFGPTPPSVSFSNDPMPTADTFNNILAPFWTDFIVGPDSCESCAVRTRTRGAAPNRRFVITYEGVTFSPFLEISGGSATFQVILREGSDQIELNYGTLSPPSPDGGEHLGSGATVGAENASGNAGLQWSHNAPSLSSGMSLWMDTSGCDCSNPAPGLVCTP